MKSRGKPVENDVKYQVREKMKRQDAMFAGRILAFAYSLPSFDWRFERIEMELKAFVCFRCSTRDISAKFHPIFFTSFLYFLRHFSRNAQFVRD